MTIAHLLLIVGLGLDILATLFLSLDARASQRILKDYFNNQIFTETASSITDDWEKSIAGTPVPASTPGADALGDAERAMIEGQRGAEIKNRNSGVDQLQEYVDANNRRAPLVIIAIVTVVAGGLLNLTSVVFF
jgi:hypothetical protein